MVGAVLMHNDIIIGEGFHQHFGQAHAEVNCIESVAFKNKIFIDKSTLYVSLEPCAHFGKTPPCADFIIKNKIPRVVIGCRDSFKAVDGKGIEKLKDAGINVTVGVLEKEALVLNKFFFTFHQHQRPYITLKWAQSADEKIAGINGKRISISNAFTNRLVHQWRSEAAAILVGTTTALKDDPALTTRLVKGNNPLRLIIDIDLKLPATLQIFNDTVKTVVFNAQKNAEDNTLSFCKINKQEKIIPQILNILYTLQIQSVIVEGGTKLLQSFIDENCWDEARVITNTEMKITEGLNAPLLKNNSLIKTENIRTNNIAYFLNNTSL